MPKKKEYIRPAYKTEMPIEPRIKPLVNLLNDIPFIKTNSSCEGHYNDSDCHRHNASVRFELKRNSKKKLESLIKAVYAQTVSHWTKGDVEFIQRFYMCPDDPVLWKQWVLTITPFSTIESPEKKRQVTDFLIKLTLQGIKNYLTSSPSQSHS